MAVWKEFESNVADGVNSFDITTGNTLVAFFNRNASPYPTEAGSPKFDLVPVTKQKDIILNVARLHAQQEYDRIMQLVSVLQKQAEELQRRMFISDIVHSAKYDFQVYPGNTYWLVRVNNEIRLLMLGPNDWSCSPPDSHEYICQVKWLGDYTWIEIKE
jgi:hypothetical protein